VNACGQRWPQRRDRARNAGLRDSPGSEGSAPLEKKRAAPSESAARTERVPLSQYLVGQFHLGMPPPGEIPLRLQLSVLDQVANTSSNGNVGNRITPALEPHPSNDHCHLGPLCSGGRQDEAIEIVM